MLSKCVGNRVTPPKRVLELCPRLLVTIGHKVKVLAFELEHVDGEHSIIRVENVLSILGACVDRDDRLLEINGLSMHWFAPWQLHEILDQRPLRLTIGSAKYALKCKKTCRWRSRIQCPR